MGGQCSHVVWLHVGQMSSVSVSTQFVSRGQSGVLCTLNIPHASLQDAGRYYCVYINGLMLLTGGGTTLTVTESRLQYPEVHLLVPADPPVDSPVPLICQASGLEDAGRVSVDWEVDETEELQRPIILSGSEAGVISEQVYVPAATWSAGAQVSCVLTDGDLSIRKTASIMTGESGQCVSLISLLGAMCVVIFVVAVTLGILLSCRQRRVNRGLWLPSQAAVRAMSSSGGPTPPYTTLAISHPAKSVTHVELHRPEKLNAMNKAFWRHV
ncbi:hypothetical protein PAMP_018175 [Pampus punctatissimus]